MNLLFPVTASARNRRFAGPLLLGQRARGERELPALAIQLPK